MTTTDMSPREESEHSVCASDWPDLVASTAFVHYEDGHFVAVLDRFSIVGMGDSPASAWENMHELASAYLDLCDREGLPFGEVVRPMPLDVRLRLRAWAVLGLLLGAIFRSRSPREQRQRFVYPHTHAKHAHAC